MPREALYDDHPLRVLQLEFGMRLEDLAKESGLSQAAVSAAMSGRVRQPNPMLLVTVGRRSGQPVEELQRRVVAWNAKPVAHLLSVRARATLLLPPSMLPALYESFAAWRAEFSGNVTRFASLLRVPRASVAEWERGERKSFPPALREALVREWGLSDEYLAALAVLPPVTPGTVHLSEQAPPPPPSSTPAGFPVGNG